MNKKHVEQFNKIPQHQKKVFLDFMANHPYQRIEYTNREGVAQTGQYIACGTGKRTLVFIHGALIEPDMWFMPILQLEDSFRIIAPYITTERMGILDAVDFILALLQQEQINSASFIGMSYGGGVAQYFGEKYPELIETLVLSHTGLLGRKDAEEGIRRLNTLARIVPPFLVRLFLRTRQKDFPGSPWNEFHKAYFTGLRQRLTKRQFMDYGASMLKFIEESKDISVEQRNWKGPTVLLATLGDEDAFQYFDQLKQLYPQAETHVFELDGGHHMLFLHPEEYSRVLSGIFT